MSMVKEPKDKSFEQVFETLNISVADNDETTSIKNKVLLVENHVDNLLLQN